MEQGIAKVGQIILLDVVTDHPYLRIRPEGNLHKTLCDREFWISHGTIVAATFERQLAESAFTEFRVRHLQGGVTQGHTERFRMVIYHINTVVGSSQRDDLGETMPGKQQ